MTPRMILGLDLGQVSDPTALAGIQPHGEDAQKRTVWALPLLKRWTLGTSYPDIVKDMAALCAKLDKPTLIVDGTGVGRPVCDLFREANLPIEALIALTITAGSTVNRVRFDEINAPKKDLVGAAQSVIQTRRLRAAKELKEFPELVRELQNFRVKINTATITESFEAWREGDKDDLVLALSMALWWGESHLEQPIGDLYHLKTRADGPILVPPEELRYEQIRFFHQHQTYQPMPAPRGQVLTGAPDYHTQEEAAWFVYRVYLAMGLEPPSAEPALPQGRKAAIEAEVTKFVRGHLPKPS